MSKKQSEAQQARRSREREAAAEAAAVMANEASESLPDGQMPPSTEDRDVPLMPTIDHSGRMEALQALRNKPDDMDEYARMEADDSTPADSEAVAKDGQFESQATEAQSQGDGSEDQGAQEHGAQDEAQELVMVKVDGEEFKVPKANIDEAGGVKAYQILKASENRLAKANKEKQDMAQLLEQAKLLIRSLQGQQAPPKEGHRPTADAIKEKIHRIQFGTPDEATQALQEIISAAAPKPVDQNALISEAVYRMQQQTAARGFIERNQDMLQNPLLAKLALVMETDKLNKSRPSDWDKFYSDMEVEFRNALGKSATTPKPSDATPQNGQPTSDREAKLERKANIVNLPTASARVEPKQEDKTLSREDKLNLLRKARGQPIG